MKKFHETVKTVLDNHDIISEHIDSIPDVTSEKVMSFIFDVLKDVYNTKMPFNKLLGIEVTELDLEKAVIVIHSREELMGNYVQKILHGGVISSLIDLSGGVAAQAHALSKMKGMTAKEMMHRFSKMSTLNMRVDYLRPGAGERFRCVSRVARAGNKVAVVQSEIYDSENRQIAIGTGSYLIG